MILALSPGTARALAGDLDGDGVVGPADEALLATLVGSVAGSGLYDPAGDLDGDGAIDGGDQALLTLALGQTGPPDTAAPTVGVTLNDIPDDMNDLLVVPPEKFQITVQLDSAGGSLIDTSSLSVRATLPFGAFPGGAELAGEFTVTPTRAFWEVPAGSNLSPTTHVLFASVSDLAGNTRVGSLAFAVRDFIFGPPLGALQTMFLDFDQDRSLGSEVDFVEDLREYGLSSAAAPAIESTMRNLVVAEIVKRVMNAYGKKADGSPLYDPVNIEFTSTPPAAPHSRLCVGGQSSQGAPFLGAAPTDVHNLAAQSDDCNGTGLFGVFPAAIDNLWSGDPGYQAVFGPVDAGLGGVPVGEHPLDPVVFGPGFNYLQAAPEEIQRFLEILDAADAFSQIVAVAIAHESGHMLGLTAKGPAPGGLFGGTSGVATDHNVTVGGSTPTQNYIMNAGNSFTFDEITGRAGHPVPFFRPMSWAYLHDRVAINPLVTALLLAPIVTGTAPNPAVYGGGASLQISVDGAFFNGPVIVDLLDPPFTRPVFGPIVNAQGTQLTGTIYSVFTPPALYDVRVTNSDGQSITLVDGLEVLP